MLPMGSHKRFGTLLRGYVAGCWGQIVRNALLAPVHFTSNGNIMTTVRIPAKPITMSEYTEVFLAILNSDKLTNKQQKLWVRFIKFGVVYEVPKRGK